MFKLALTAAVIFSAQASAFEVLELAKFGHVHCSSASQEVWIDKVQTHISLNDLYLDLNLTGTKTKYDLSQLAIHFENIQIISQNEYDDPKYYGHTVNTELVAKMTVWDNFEELYSGLVLCDKSAYERID